MLGDNNVNDLDNRTEERADEKAKHKRRKVKPQLDEEEKEMRRFLQELV